LLHKAEESARAFDGGTRNAHKFERCLLIAYVKPDSFKDAMQHIIVRYKTVKCCHVQSLRQLQTIQFPCK